MSTSDEIEKMLERRRGAESDHEEQAREKHQRLIAAGRQSALGFIDLMRKHNIDPEIVYRHKQVRVEANSWSSRSRHRVIERFEPVDQGWVVDFKVTEGGSPSLITYLRPDGLVSDCDHRCIWKQEGHTIEGQIASSTPKAIPYGVLCEKSVPKGARGAWYDLNQYATAAGYYLDRFPAIWAEMQPRPQPRG